MKILLPLCFLITCPVWAADSDCQFLQIEELEGKVTIQSGSDPLVEATPDDVFSMGDRLETGADSWVDLRFCDGGVTRIGENSQYEYLAPSSETDWIQWSFSLVHGSLRALIQGENKEIKFRLKTPTAALGVRGTEFFVDVTADESQVYTLAGSVLWGEAGDWQQLSRQAKPDEKRFQVVSKDFFSSFKRGEKRVASPKKFSPRNFEVKKFQILRKKDLIRTQGFRAPRLGKKNSPLFQKNRPILQKRLQNNGERPKSSPKGVDQQRPRQNSLRNSSDRPNRKLQKPNGQRPQPQRDGRTHR